MRNLLLIALSLFSISSCAQKQEIVFKSEVKPNTQYVTVIKTSSTTKMDFKGAEEKVQAIKSQGITLPMVVGNSIELKTDMRTGSLESNETFPAYIEYGDVVSTQVSNGEESKLESPISGIRIEGYYDPQIFRVDTIIGDKIDENTRYTLRSTLENVQEQITFPEKPLKVGDSFTQRLPMSIPVAGLEPVQVLIETTYVLSSIENYIARFDIEQDIRLDATVKQTNIESSGTGTGISEYDINNQYITKYKTDSDISLKINVEDLVIVSEIKSKSEQIVAINDSN